MHVALHDLDMDCSAVRQKPQVEEKAFVEGQTEQLESQVGQVSSFRSKATSVRLVKQDHLTGERLFAETGHCCSQLSFAGLGALIVACLAHCEEGFDLTHCCALESHVDWTQ